MRSKEEAHDYRYFPCPDLLPLEIEQAWVDHVRDTMPELPDAKKARFMADFGLTDYDAGVLTAELDSAAFFETVARGRDGKQAANWVINELFGRLNREGRSIGESPLSAAQLGGVLDLIGSGEISGKMAKDLFDILWTEGGDPAAVAAARGMKQVTDTAAIEAALDALIAANPEQVEKARVNAKLAGWFTGQVLKATGGKANPAIVNAMVARKLGL
jgi:aspartyl-tRNA(Asn)/glutamyl-tRNA(Gln) amidotransferase subunit B